MMCPNEILLFGKPVGGTNKSMRKESMEVVDVASDISSGGRKVILKAQNAQDSIMLAYAQLPNNSCVNSTIDVLENAVVCQRRHVKCASAEFYICCSSLTLFGSQLYQIHDTIEKLYLVALKKTESKERPLSSLPSERFRLQKAFTPEFMSLIQRLIVISNEFQELILQQLRTPISHKTFLNISA
jgi:hypothetical protein